MFLLIGKNIHEIPAFGFETRTGTASAFVVKGGGKRDLAKIAAMIPVIGAIIGLIRLIASAKAELADGKEKAPHILRSVVEIVGLGSLLFIPDLITTLGRMCQKPQDLI